MHPTRNGPDRQRVSRQRAAGSRQKARAGCSDASLCAVRCLLPALRMVAHIVFAAEDAIDMLVVPAALDEPGLPQCPLADEADFFVGTDGARVVGEDFEPDAVRGAVVA